MPGGSIAAGRSAEAPLDLETTQIYEGTNQIQRIVMARKLLERY